MPRPENFEQAAEMVMHEIMKSEHDNYPKGSEVKIGFGKISDSQWRFTTGYAYYDLEQKEDGSWWLYVAARTGDYPGGTPLFHRELGAPQTAPHPEHDRRLQVRTHISKI